MLEALEILGSVEADAVLDGGWGIDALVGSVTRPHGDLDVAMRADRLETAVEALGSRGFRHDPTIEPGMPARFVLRDADGRQIDLHPLVFDDEGNGWQRLGDRSWGLYPAEGLTGAGRINGQPVRCLTAELQLRHHLGYEWSDTDEHDMRLLRDHFGIVLPPGG